MFSNFSKIKKMKNIEVQDRIEALENLFNKRKKEDDNFRYNPQLNYFLLISIYATAQYCIKTIVVSYI